MDIPFIISEDSPIRELKSQIERNRIRPMLPRVAIAGFGISLLAVITVNHFVELDLKTAIVCVIAPTSIMLAYLLFAPLLTKFVDSKWTIKEKKIQMSDGFFILAKNLNSWSYSIEDFQCLEGYRKVTLRSNNGLSKSIVLKDLNLLQRLVDYLMHNNANQTVQETGTVASDE